MSTATAPAQPVTEPVRTVDEHALDAADPCHGTDLDPCNICDPGGFDQAVLAISRTVGSAAQEAS